MKLQNPPEFTDRKSDISVEHWLAKIEDKMTADQDLMTTSKKRIIYVINCVGGKAFSHLEPRAQKNATNLWKDLDEMLAYLERVFGNPNRRQNAVTEF